MNFETKLQNFAEIMIEKTDLFVRIYPEVLKFWQDGFHRYLKKMKEPKDAQIDTNPRRYFHLHAINYILKNCAPEVIWHLCPGNIRTIFPIMEQFMEKSRSDERIIYWINIDLVPEIKTLNENLLKEKWPAAKIVTNGEVQLFQVYNFKIINLVGTIETFFEVYENCKFYETRERQVLICIDGIANAVIKPEDWVHWWLNINYRLIQTFSAWYFTWLNAATLELKFEFYYNTALLKHKHPINWLESNEILLSQLKNEKLHLKISDYIFEEFNEHTFKDISKNKGNDENNFIFRFYKDKDKRKLVYQTFYLHLSDLEKILRIKDRQKKKNMVQKIGHREVDSLLFSFSTAQLYNGKEINFVKSIPYLGINNR